MRVDEDVLSNDGCLRPVVVHIPPGSLLSPSAGRAVAAGNVETSQRFVDVLPGALGIVAASQGTMNHLTFGDASFGYYETLGGGVADRKLGRDSQNGVGRRAEFDVEAGGAMRLETPGGGSYGSPR